MDGKMGNNFRACDYPYCCLSHYHQKQVKEDRQKEFEDTLMSGVSEAEREQIWDEAAKVVSSLIYTARKRAFTLHTSKDRAYNSHMCSCAATCTHAHTRAHTCHIAA